MIYGVLWKFFLDNMTNIRSGEVQILEGWKNQEKRPISRTNQKKGFHSGKLRKISGQSLSDVALRFSRDTVNTGTYSS
jgi:hypothetical protein